jgi:hypothetical protein
MAREELDSDSKVSRLSPAMIRHAIVWSASITCFVVACGGQPVGRICDLGITQPDPASTLVASPSLDCVSRQCLHVPLGRQLPMGSTYPSGPTGLCSAGCQQDSDCDTVPESPCKTGFTCGIPPGLTVGPFCCEKFCVCRDYVQIPMSTGQLVPPMACDGTNSANACCNLAGRRGNSMYPGCP